MKPYLAYRAAQSNPTLYRLFWALYLSLAQLDPNPRCSTHPVFWRQIFAMDSPTLHRPDKPGGEEPSDTLDAADLCVCGAGAGLPRGHVGCVCAG